MQEPPLDEIDLLAGEALARFEEGGTAALDAFVAEHTDRAHELRQALEGVVLFEHAVGASTRIASDIAGLLDIGATSGLAPGVRVGDFVIQGELGRGGMGIVHRARQRRLQRDVALKILPPEFTASPERVKRFIREARTCARLSHPGVVTVYDAGLADGICYLAMELVEGETLARVFDQGLLTEAWAVEIGRQVAGALAAAHDAGLLHRDVKPGNIMLSGATMKLMDFGLALDRSEEAVTLTRSGVILGTPAYMSPEQIDSGGRELDGRSDVYSLGVVLYEGLTGQLPYSSEHSGTMLREIRDRQPLPPLRRGRRLPRDLETILMRCLEKRPEQRYSSAAALRDDLERYSRGEPIAARPIPRVVRAYRWVESHPVRTTAALGLAAVVIVATYLFTRLDAGETIRQYEALLLTASERIEALEDDLAKRDRELAAVAAEREEVAARHEDVNRQRAQELEALTDAAEEARMRALAVRDAERALGAAELALRLERPAEAERILAGWAERIDELADERLGTASAGLREQLATLAAGDPQVEPEARTPEAPAPDDRPATLDDARAAIAIAQDASAQRDYGRAAAQLGAALDRVEIESPEVVDWRRQLEVTGAAARVMEAARAGLASRVGKRIEVANRTGGAVAGKLEELALGDGEGAFWLGLEAGGRVKVQLRAVDAAVLLEWAAAAVTHEERIGFLLAEGDADAALVLARKEAPPGALALHVLSEQAARDAAAYAASFPGATLALHDGELEVRWDFEDGKAPPQLELAGNWRIEDGRLMSRDDVVLVAPLRSTRAAHVTVEVARPTSLTASMGGASLSIQGDAGDPILLTAGGDSMRSGAASVPALSDRLVLGSAMPRMRPATGGLVIEAITLRLVVTDDWLDAMHGPRRTLASWHFAAGDAAWAQAGIDVDERAPGGSRVMVARSREEETRAAPPAPPRGGRPPPPLRSAGQVVEIAAPVDFDLRAPGMRIDVDFALEARERLRRCSLVLIGEGDRVLAEIGLEPFTPGAWIRRSFVPGDEILDTAGLSPGQRVQSIALQCADAGQPFELRVSDLVVTCRGEATR